MKFMQDRGKMVKKYRILSDIVTGAKMLDKVKNFIKKHNMISKGDRIVVGISGGADSVCLFHVLLKLVPVYNLTLFGVHVNHGIRGKEADEDEAYVEKLCSGAGVSYTVFKADIRAIAAAKGLSEEEAGRKVRYEAFYDCFRKNKCNKIAIAHNRNDNAETILFHLFRGSGIKGLTGIPPVREEIIRPLLDLGRDDIESYLKENGISFQTDRTNLTQDYSRNKIRHQIINFAREEINVRAIEHIVSASEKLTEIDRYLDKNITAAFYEAVIYVDRNKEYEVNIKKLKEKDPVIQKGIIRKIFNQLANQLKDVDALHVEMVLKLTDKQVGKSLDLPYGILAVRNYDSLTIKKAARTGKNAIPLPGCMEVITEQKLPVPGSIRLLQSGQILEIKLINYKKNMIIPKNGCTKWFDYDKIKNTVLIRSRKEGDYIQIDSAGSRKKIKSLFIDEKVPREKRGVQPLLADGDHIMWVVGGRMSEAYKINEETKVILEIKIDGGKQDEQQY